ncbi:MULTISPECIES: dihydroneopterin triphosphate 2'-epimerase [unclassified Pseudomonas]|uniref:dihydroneopterin triphosphate 2'-epimerase n=1 Tax=unclassified Pseudomonas TaxID=196821 RepID=UPI0025E1A223|nr:MULTISPECIES: dihydroneopterin triphosphate 2'-epimerase [unclassified Pseudomonas]
MSPPAAGHARIQVKNLRLRTCVGINEQEFNNRQDVVINFTLDYVAQEAIENERIDQALNYRLLTKSLIRHVERNRFGLLERMAQELLDLLMHAPQVLSAVIEVDKPHALRFADSVSVTLAASRPAR